MKGPDEEHVNPIFIHFQLSLLSGVLIVYFLTAQT
jgi:hypothetical protein